MSDKFDISKNELKKVGLNTLVIMCLAGVSYLSQQDFGPFWVSFCYVLYDFLKHYLRDTHVRPDKED